MNRIAKTYNKLDVITYILDIAETTGFSFGDLCNPCFSYIEASSDELAQDHIVLSVFLSLLQIHRFTLNLVTRDLVTRDSVTMTEVESYIDLLIKIQKDKHINPFVLSKLQISKKYDLAELMASVLHLDNDMFRKKLSNNEISHKTLFKVASLSELSLLIDSHYIQNVLYKDKVH